MNPDKSNLKGFKIKDLVITQTVVGLGTKESICRNVYQIWTKDSEFITTFDYEDIGYSVIESIYNGGHEK
ncbi:MAG: hypothetical protein ACTJE9_06960 [Lactococcus lactis]|uniref:hypothetical protein n=1 Tax=Lactococcus lactis TaxID=1358 RepID=UPI003853FBB5